MIDKWATKWERVWLELCAREYDEMKALGYIKPKREGWVKK